MQWSQSLALNPERFREGVSGASRAVETGEVPSHPRVPVHVAASPPPGHPPPVPVGMLSDSPASWVVLVLPAVVRSPARTCCPHWHPLPHGADGAVALGERHRGGRGSHF